MGKMKTTEYYTILYPIKIKIFCRYDVKISHVLVVAYGIILNRICFMCSVVNLYRHY